MFEGMIEVEENTADCLVLDVYFPEGMPPETLEYEAQVALEQEMQQLAVDKFLSEHRRNEAVGRASETEVYAQLIKKELMAVVMEMENQFNTLCSESNGNGIEAPLKSRETRKVIEKIRKNMPFETLALIGLNETINHLSFTDQKSPFESSMLGAMGDAIDFQCFVGCINEADPELVRVISRFYLQDKSRRQRKRVQMAYDFAGNPEEFEHEFLSETEKNRIAHFVKECIYAGTGLFESFPTFRDTDKKTRYVILLTDLGEKVIDKIISAATKNVGNSFPMIAEPKPWGRNTPGGYYLTQPGQRSLMIHNASNTIASDLAIESLNNLQRIKWKVNTFILDVQKSFADKTINIGSFRTYEPETYGALHPILNNPEIEEMKWDDAKEDPELLAKKKKAYAITKNSEKDETMAQNQAIASLRSMDMAERFRNQEYIMLPWYFDNRLRQYCLVDTLNPQGSDNVKSLIMFYEGVPKSEQSYKEMLISLATTYGNGLDKLPYEQRIESAKQMVPVFSLVCRDPLASTAYEFWSKADEPFQFLALVKEYHDVFITNEQDKHYVSTGRDATCSGIQLAGALLRDAKTCHLVNVTPSDSVQDAYKAVADEAIKLLQDSEWLSDRITQREANRLKTIEAAQRKAKKRALQGKRQLREIPPFEERKDFEASLDLIDRSVAKMVVMLTPYGGTYPTMLDHVVKKMQKKGSECPYSDYSIVTHALIEGMNTALPGFSALNEWFNELAKAALAKGLTNLLWVTPSMSTVKQEYFKDESIVVCSYLHGTKKIRHNTSTRRPTKEEKEVEERKMQTALAANTIHSLDASLLQLALHDYSGGSFTTVHDCVYAPSGALEPLCERIRNAFIDVVKGPFLYSMLETNGLSDNNALKVMLDNMMHDNEDLLDTIKDSKYLFS